MSGNKIMVVTVVKSKVGDLEEMLYAFAMDILYNNSWRCLRIYYIILNLLSGLYIYTPYYDPSPPS